MSYEPEYPERGIAAFRVFVYSPTDKESESPLRSLFAHYRWTAGEQVASMPPSLDNAAGFYAHKNYIEAVFYSGQRKDAIFALSRHYGKTVEGETGLRSEKAEIVAFLEPSQPSALKAFPRGHLRKVFPEIPIIKVSEVDGMIEEHMLKLWPKRKPFPFMQWLGHDDKLLWAPEHVGPPSSVPEADRYEMLEPASSYPRETHPLDQRLRKGSYRGQSGVTYMYWYLGGVETPYEGAKEVLNLTYSDPEEMQKHRV